MTWVESVSASFTARHDAAATDDARHLLQSLERTRAHLQTFFPRGPGDVTLVLHGGPAGLVATNPMMPFVWLATAPAARRYIVGWAGRTELHMLEPALLRQRASNVPGSAQMLEYGAACLYARRVIIASNKDLERVMPRAAPAPGAALGLAAGGGGALVRRPDRARPPRHRPAPARGRSAELPARPARRHAAGRNGHRPAGARAGRGGRRAVCRPPAPAGSPRGADHGLRRPAAGPHRGGVALAPGAAGRPGV